MSIEDKIDRLTQEIQELKKVVKKEEPQPKCQHLRVQAYTECCEDCGKNIYD